MSYILDALRKADAERERGHVPGIHAQPMFAGAPGASAPRIGRPWKWIAIGLLVLLVGVLLWSLRRGGGEPASTPTVATLPAPVPVAPAPAPVAEPKRAAAKPAASPKVEAKAAASAPAVAASGASAPGAASEARVYALNELPDEIRRQLPALAIGGSMYSNKPVDRILIINGLVLHEGDKITPELVLQQIKLKAVVLAFKGYRVEITF